MSLEISSVRVTLYFKKKKGYGILIGNREPLKGLCRAVTGQIRGIKQST